MSDHSSLFGIPLFEMQLEGFESHQTALINAFIEMQQKDKGIVRSNHGGWHSRGHLHHQQHPEIQWLMSNVFERGTQAIRSYESDKPFNGVRLHTSWVNINPNGAWNAPHMHLPADWAGVIYIQINEQPDRKGNQANDGDIMFFNPSPYGAQYNSKPVLSRTPANGKIFLFPGYLLHMVAPHFDEQERISVAFNFKLSYSAPKTD